MATGDNVDGIEVAESSFTSRRDDHKKVKEGAGDDDGKEKASVPPPVDTAAAGSVTASNGPKTPTSITRHKSERERKIGHRRVGVGGEITYKKIQTSQIMGSIQLGIQHAVGGLASKPERDLLMQDFMTVETTNFPSEGSNHTPAHHYSEFRFRTYAPIAFRYFRDLFGIQPDDFLISMCSAPLRELSNPGASGSIFYLTDDDEFIIKTVQHKEGEFLQKLLPGYYMNLNQNPRTLLPKFFGLFCYQCNSKNVRLVAMNNLLPSSIKLHQKYDLKGSTYKRKASKSERQKSSPTYKDLDFIDHHPEGIGLEAETYSALIKTIQRDCRVLESFKIMDYSLLVGIHNLDQASREKAEQKSHSRLEAADSEEQEIASEEKDKDRGATSLNRSRSINRQRLVAHSTAMESIQAESEPIDEEDDVPPGGIPARNSRGERLLLFIGIIDILQSYRLKKKLEHTWKAMIHDGDTVSVHRPGFYAQRFQDFMAKTVFKKIPSLCRIGGTPCIALKHSPSKRKSISRPLRGAVEAETGDGAAVQTTSAVATQASKPGSPTGVGIAPPVATSTPVTIPGPSVPALKPSSPPVTMATASPPSYPAVLKDRPPSFGKSLPPPGGVPSASGKIPPPVPPRGSPLGKRGDASAAAPRGGLVRHFHTYHQFHHRTLKSEKIRMSPVEQHGSKLHAVCYENAKIVGLSNKFAPTCDNEHASFTKHEYHSLSPQTQPPPSYSEVHLIHKNKEAVSTLSANENRDINRIHGTTAQYKTRSSSVSCTHITENNCIKVTPIGLPGKSGLVKMCPTSPVKTPKTEHFANELKDLVEVNISSKQRIESQDKFQPENVANYYNMLQDIKNVTDNFRRETQDKTANKNQCASRTQGQFLSIDPFCNVNTCVKNHTAQKDRNKRKFIRNSSPDLSEVISVTKYFEGKTEIHLLDNILCSSGRKSELQSSKYRKQRSLDLDHFDSDDMV